jgi:dynein light intermediate chain
MPELSFRCADELIRQVTLDSPERGLLLLRVRDEIRMTLDAYRTLYGSSVTFGVRKQMQAELGMPEVEAEIGVRSGGGWGKNDNRVASLQL